MKEPMVEMFVLETSQLVKLMEQSIIESKETDNLALCIDEVFRITHVIKGNSSMMLYDNISLLTHHVAYLISYFKNPNPDSACFAKAAELILEGLNFINGEINKIDEEKKADGNPEKIILKIEDYLGYLKEECRPRELNPIILPEGKGSKPHYYIKSLKNPDESFDNSSHTNENKHSVINLTDYQQSIKCSLKANSDKVCVNAGNLNKLFDVVRELADSEETAYKLRQGELSSEESLGNKNSRTKLINDLENIVLSIMSGN